MNGFGFGERRVFEVAAAVLGGGGFVDELDLLGLGFDAFGTGSSDSSVMVTIDGDWKGCKGKLA